MTTNGRGRGRRGSGRGQGYGRGGRYNRFTRSNSYRKNLEIIIQVHNKKNISSTLIHMVNKYMLPMQV